MMNKIYEIVAWIRSFARKKRFDEREKNNWYKTRIKYMHSSGHPLYTIMKEYIVGERWLVINVFLYKLWADSASHDISININIHGDGEEISIPIHGATSEIVSRAIDIAWEISCKAQRDILQICRHNEQKKLLDKATPTLKRITKDIDGLATMLDMV